MDTPVAFIIFNRPDLTRRSFEQIRAAEPRQLFLIADGPRESRPAEVELCAETRQVVEAIDWECEVRRDFSPVNLGCRVRVSSGIDKVFDSVDRAIIIEDDCVPHQDFFTFCDELLNRYEDDPRVGVITGDNFQGGVLRGDGSYYFSKYNHVWGWATWRRAWQHYDVRMEFWPGWRDSAEFTEVCPDPAERSYWRRQFDRVHAGRIDTWDLQWTAANWHEGLLTATPNVNLVANLGFGPEATHTKVPTAAASMPTERIGELVHPSVVTVDAAADRLTYDRMFGDMAARSRRRPIGFARWAFGETRRRLAGRAW